MGKPPPIAALVAASGRTLRLAAAMLRAITSTVDLAAVAAAADQHLAATACAHEQSS
jgi:hypothetical protein